MQRPKLLKPTNTQTTWKTVRGMVAKNLISLILTGHPLGLIENIIHTPIDWIVNKNLCTDNKLLNIGLHVATCLSVDSLIHGSGHEIAENLMGDHAGHAYSGAQGVDQAGISDTSTSYESSKMYNPDNYPSYETYTPDYDTDASEPELIDDSIGSKTIASPTMEQLGQRGGIWAKIQEMHDATHFAGDGHDHGAELVGGDANSHTGYDHGSHEGHAHTDHAGHDHHTGHDHAHGGHGVLPILGGAIIEEYGPTMYKITKKRTQGLLSRMFNYDTGSETIIVKKSELSNLENKLLAKSAIKSQGGEVDFKPNIVADTNDALRGGGKIIPLGGNQKQLRKVA